MEHVGLGILMDGERESLGEGCLSRRIGRGKSRHGGCVDRRGRSGPVASSYTDPRFLNFSRQIGWLANPAARSRGPTEGRGDCCRGLGEPIAKRLIQGRRFRKAMRIAAKLDLFTPSISTQDSLRDWRLAFERGDKIRGLQRELRPHPSTGWLCSSRWNART